jgi:hypothetical protein
MSADDFIFLPTSNCAFQVDGRSFTYTRFSGVEDLTMIINGQKLIDFDADFVHFAKPDNSQFVSYAKDSLK